MRLPGTVIVELLPGISLIVAGFALRYWAYTMIWIMVYPLPAGKQMLDLLPFLLWVCGGMLTVDGLRCLFILPRRLKRGIPETRVEPPVGELAHSGSNILTALLRIGGYLVPLVQQVPPLGVYVGLMTLPVIAYLALLFSSFPNGVLAAVGGLLMWSFSTVHGLISVLGFLFAVYSVLYLRLHKRNGLVTTGPYGLARHPQYVGLLLWTIGLTGWSYWLLTNTFGVGWLTPQDTIGLWYAELCAYLALALVEESYLSKRFCKDYAVYKSHVPFFIPTGKATRYDIPVTILTLSIILFGVVSLGSNAFTLLPL